MIAKENCAGLWVRGAYMASAERLFVVSQMQRGAQESHMGRSRQTRASVCQRVHGSPLRISVACTQANVKLRTIKDFPFASGRSCEAEALRAVVHTAVHGKGTAVHSNGTLAAQYEAAA
jgi:hypothetical protein